MSVHVRVRSIGWAVLVLAGISVAARDSGAAALSWNNAAGGSAATPGNWSPVQMPAAGDDLTFNLSATYTVSWGSTVAASRTHLYRDGTVTLNISSPHTVSNGIIVGDVNGDSATMTVTTGTITSNGTAIFGDDAGSSGALIVNDDDADFLVGNGADLFLGNSGDAALTITGSGRVEVADQFLAGLNASSSPTITVSGFTVAPIGASVLRALGTGESRIGAGGDVTMTISSGATADFNGDLIIANGSASNSSITVHTQGLFNASLNVDGDLMIGRNSSATAAGTGTLQINTGGQAQAGGRTQLGDPNGGTGFINLGGGQFSSTDTIEVLAGSTIAGAGTINGDISNLGNILPSGTGLILNGILSNTTNNISGTKIHFGATGGYSGSGSCATDITGDAAATITATGDLEIGRNTTTGVSYNGNLVVGDEAVALVDSNGAVLGGLTTIDGGELSCTSGIGLALGGRIRGEGTLIGNTIFSGVLDAQREGTPGGILQVNGNLTMNPSSTLDVEIGGAPQANEHDRVNVSGTASFAGTVQVSLPTGFTPKVGQQFILINAVAGRSDEFDDIEPPNPAPCNDVTFVMVYSSTAGIMLVRPPLGCTALGDLNSDGGCDGRDIQQFTDGILDGLYDSCADMNGDCAVDEDDVPVYLNCLL